MHTPQPIHSCVTVIRPGDLRDAVIGVSLDEWQMYLTPEEAQWLGSAILAALRASRDDESPGFYSYMADHIESAKLD